jgi:hypothetical protein
MAMKWQVERIQNHCPFILDFHQVMSLAFGWCSLLYYSQGHGESPFSATLTEHIV